MNNPLLAQQKKGKKSGEKKQNIIKRAYSDIATRNNYYFNANVIYQEMLLNAKQNEKIDFKTFYPIFFHDGGYDFSSNAGELDEIIKKTGIVLQLHENGRWGDNTYLLLGIATYLKKDYPEALKTFQYISTTMKGNIGREAPEISNKEKMKILKQKEKEAQKKIKAKKKSIIENAKAKAKEIADKVSNAKSKMQSSQKSKEKILEEKIKLKKKIIALKAKGKDTKSLEEKYKQLGNENQEELAKEKEAKKEQAELKEIQDGDTAIDYSKLNYKFSIKKEEKKLDPLDRNNDQPLDAELTDKERKKLEEDYDDRSLWEKVKHKSSRPSALVWMAKSLTELGHYGDAKSILTYSKSLKKLSKKQREEIYLGDAWYNLKRSQYATAIEDLEVALKLEKGKARKAQINFLIGQLYEAINDPGTAVDRYQMALKKPKNFDLEFYAQMSIARLAVSSNTGDQEKIEKTLKKLIKGGKNKDFADQVHYAIAIIELNKGNEEEAVKQLVLSTQKSTNNQEQKGLSFLKLAELELAKENYLEAKNDYDSAVAVLPSTFPRISEVIEIKEILEELAKNKTIIIEQDSVLRIAKMTKVELENYMAEIEKANRLAEKEAKKKNNRNNSGDGNNLVDIDNSTSFDGQDTHWYFYNPELKAKGYNIFKATFGNIKNSDNWRNSQKKANEELEETEIQIEAETVAEVKTEKKKIEIPKTPDEIKFSEEAVHLAYFNLGVILKNKLKNNKQAVTKFETLINKYPSNKFEAQSHYYLYLIYMEEGNLAKANAEKAFILSKFPDSEYAKTIQNPVKYAVNAPKAIVTSTDEEKLYASIYTLFEAKNYNNVITQKEIINPSLSSIDIKSKADLLEALSYGKLNKTDTLKLKLQSIITNYSGSDIAKKAEDYLKTLAKLEGKEVEPIDNSIPTISEDVLNAENGTADENGFIHNESSNFFIFVLCKNKEMDLSGIKEKIVSFNETNYPNEKLRTNITFLQDNIPAYLIKKFDKITDAKKYADKLNGRLPKIAGEQNVDELDLVIISQDNYKTLFNNKNFEAYKAFYQKHFK